MDFQLKAVLQRASFGSVTINEKEVGKIDGGLVILLGVMNDDEIADADFLVNKITGLRIFNDEHEKMNLSIQDIHGSALVVSQFTLCADTSKGRRPSFIKAAGPDKGKLLYEHFVSQLKDNGITTATGEFGAMMNVQIMNAGPVTIILDSKE